MAPNHYKQAALRTENTPMFVEHARRGLSDTETAVEQWNRAINHDQRLSRMIHAVLGMITELGELCDPLKRHLIYGAMLDTKNMAEERGDQEWYGNLMNDALEVKLTDIWERNIAKLCARFPDKFTNEQAVNRDLVAEQKALDRDLDAQQRSSHLMDAMRRIAHRCGVDAPREIESRSNERIADLCIKHIDETESKLRAFRDAHRALSEAAK